MGIAAARSAAHGMREKVLQGADPNLDKREEAKAAEEEARRQVSVKDVLDTYETSVLAHHRSGGNTRRSLDGKRGLLTTLASRPLVSLTRLEIGDLVKEHAKVAPIGANRKLALASAFFNWCVDEGLLEANPITGMRKASGDLGGDGEARLSFRAVVPVADRASFPARGDRRRAYRRSRSRAG
jgi:hypothetical protein